MGGQGPRDNECRRLLRLDASRKLEPSRQPLAPLGIREARDEDRVEAAVHERRCDLVIAQAIEPL